MTQRACPAGFAGTIPWRLRVDGPSSGHENMRADESLLEAQKDPGALPVLRFFLWAHPTLSFGRLQNSHSARNLGMLSRVTEAVRRPTGGGTVLHDKDLSFSLAWRRDHPGFPACLKDIYRGIHGAVRDGLAERGVRTEFHKPARAGVGGAVCFESPAEDDLMRGERKVLGGAVRVTAWGRLYQGNLLTEALGGTAGEWAEAFTRAFEKSFFRRPPET